VVLLGAAGTDTARLQTLLTEYTTAHGITSAWEYVYATEVAEIGPSAVLALGVVLMPLVFFLAIRRTRQHRGRNLSYVFALAVFAPLAALVGNAALGALPLYVDLLGYLLVPVLAGLFLIGRRFVWTPLRRLLA
jgi:hypothetical protein